MAIKEQVCKTIDNLSEFELHQVAEYISFLKFQSRIKMKPSIDVQDLADLYTEFSDCDRKLAEAGIEEFAKDLLAEDTK